MARCGVSRRDPFIAADFIAGFPGETEAEAGNDVWISRAPAISPGSTPSAFHRGREPRAASMPGRVPERLAGERVEALRDLGRTGRDAYVRRWTGADVTAIIEDARGVGSTRATAENYLKLGILGLPSGTLSGQSILCRIDGGQAGSATGDFDAFASYIRPGP